MFCVGQVSDLSVDAVLFLYYYFPDLSRVSKVSTYHAFLDGKCQKKYGIGNQIVAYNQEAMLNDSIKGIVLYNENP